MPSLEQRFHQARHDPSLAVLEGFHAVKHALRFGAEPAVLVATDAAELRRLAADLAPDVAARLAAAELVPEGALGRLVPRAPRTGVVAIAARPPVVPEALLASGDGPPLVLLEAPRTLGNVGACVRVAAAAGAAGLLTTGPSDPWHPDALRGGAGLQFALPVARVPSLDAVVGGPRPLLAFDPAGEPFCAAAVGPGAILAFGTERDGCSDDLLRRASRVLALPMAAGVSSLNLATSVAAVLYAWRLAVG